MESWEGAPEYLRFPRSMDTRRDLPRCIKRKLHSSEALPASVEWLVPTMKQGNKCYTNVFKVFLTEPLQFLDRVTGCPELPAT